MCNGLEIVALTLKNETSPHRKLWMLGSSHQGPLTLGLHSGRAQSLDRSLVKLCSGPTAPSGPHPNSGGLTWTPFAFVWSIKTPNAFPFRLSPSPSPTDRSSSSADHRLRVLPRMGMAPVAPNATQPSECPAVNAHSRQLGPQCWLFYRPRCEAKATPCPPPVVPGEGWKRVGNTAGQVSVP